MLIIKMSSDSRRLSKADEYMKNVEVRNDMSGEFEVVLKMRMLKKRTTYYVVGHIQSGDPSDESRVTAVCIRRWDSLTVNTVRMTDLWVDRKNRRELRAYFVHAGLSRDQIENPIL